MEIAFINLIKYHRKHTIPTVNLLYNSVLTAPLKYSSTNLLFRGGVELNKTFQSSRDGNFITDG